MVVGCALWSNICFSFLSQEEREKENAGEEEETGRDDTSSNEDQNDSRGEKETSEKEDLSGAGSDEEDGEGTQQESLSLSTSVYEVVSLNDVPSEAKGEQSKKAEDVEDNKEVRVEEKEDDVKNSTTSAETLKAAHEEIAESENNDEVVEEIELIGDDKTALSDSIIILEKESEENGEESHPLAEVSPDRRITRGYLNTSLEGKDQEIELLKEEKSDKSNILEESDFNESEDDSPNPTPEKSGNDDHKSKLNDSFKVDLRPSWMMKKNFGERN